MFLPDEAEEGGYEGIIEVSGLEFYAHVSSNGTIEGDEVLEQLLSNRIADLQHLAKKVSVQELEDELVSAIASSLRKRKSHDADAALTTHQIGLHANSTFAAPKPGFFRSVVQEIASIGWDKLSPCASNTNLSLSQLLLHSVDQSGRQWQFSLALPAAYPSSSPSENISIQSDLPGAGVTCNALRIAEAVEACEQLVQHWCPVIDELSDLDAELCVLEPQEPKRSDLHRRVLLSSTSGGAVHFKLRDDSADAALAHPPADLKLVGSETLVAPLRANAADNASLWMSEKRLVSKLERLIGTTLPRRTDIAQEGDMNAGAAGSPECAICYSDRIPQNGVVGPLPEEPCQNSACGRVYHRSCLIDWLYSEGARRAFDTLIGSCPYCSYPITLAG